MSAAGFPSLLQRFFAERLIRQLGASPHTVASYRDTFRLLFRFASDRLGRRPSDLRIDDLDAMFLVRFLIYLEKERHVSVRTRNTRLAALHSFFRYVAFSEPAHALLCQRVLAIPRKRHECGPVEFLSEHECNALVAAPDTSKWIGKRDHALLLLAVQTGLRNSEIISLTRQDIVFGIGAHVRCLGKGRKARNTPLQVDVVKVLKAWTVENLGKPDDPLFPSSRGGFLSPDALQHLVARHVVSASQTCPSLTGRTITPHTLRHSTAMALLQRGVDLTVIALWLGHESTETTLIYMHADMQLKERALAHASASGTVPDRFRPPDNLLAFLESL
ncbi:MAG: tyrosine-type recombinase/integrase [bacterium]|nr:tyrosine-type recombinase/integrase [bacterium]